MEKIFNVMWSIVTVQNRNEAHQLMAKGPGKNGDTMKMLLRLKSAGAVLLAIVFFALSMPVPVPASPAVDRNKLGSITINLSEDTNAQDVLAGIQFTVYQVAKLSVSGEYTLTDAFANSGVQLNKLSTAAELLTASKTLVSYVTARNISGSTNVTNSEGKVSFQELTLGYYLVIQTASNQNYYIICDPFLIPVPMVSGDNKAWEYQINAYPKSETVHGAVILEKMNSSLAFLSGAVFRLERKIYYTDIASRPAGVQTGSDSVGNYYWNELMTALITNNYGQIAIKNLQLGQYRLIETKAPPGYQLDASPHEFSITAGGAVKLIDGKYVTASGTVQTIKVLNSYENNYYYNTPTPYPTSTPTPTPSVKNPTPSPEPTKKPAITPVVPTVTKALEEVDIEDEEVPLGTKDTKITPTDTPKKGKPSTGFDLPKTGGSMSYAVCTYGGTGLIICGVAVFVLSRIKKP